LVAGTYRPHCFGLGGVGLLYDGNGEGHETIVSSRVPGPGRWPTSGRTPKQGEQP